MGISKEEIREIVIESAREEISVDWFNPETDINTDLRSLGVDSLEIVETAVSIEERMRERGYDIIVEEPIVKSLSDIVKMIEKQIVDE